MSTAIHRGFTATLFGKFITALAAAAFLGLGYAMTTSGEARETTWQFASADIFGDPRERPMLAETRDVAPLLEEIRTSFPEDFDRLQAIEDGLAANDAPTADIAAARARYVDGFSERIVPTIARADTASLLELRDHTVELVHTLRRESSVACAQFFSKGVIPGAAASRELTGAIDETGRSLIRTAANARKAVVSRSAADRSDRAALIQAMGVAGAQQHQLLALEAGKMHVLTDDDQCETGFAIWRGMQLLPDEQSARMVVMLQQVTS